MSTDDSQVADATTAITCNNPFTTNPFSDPTAQYLKTLFGPAEAAGILGPHAAIILLVREAGRAPHLLKCCVSINEARDTVHANREKPLGIKTALYDAVAIMRRSETLPPEQQHLLIGETSEISYVVGCMLDVDAGKDGYEPRNVAIDAIDSMPVPASMIVSSRPNMGVHPYWIFREPIPVKNADDAKQLNYRFWRWNKEVSIRGNGMKVDSCSGIERMLRPVGCLRDDGEPVELLRWTANQTSVDDLELPALAEETDNRYEQGGDGEGGGAVETYLDMAGITIEDLLTELGCKARGDDEWTRPQEPGEDVPTDRSGVVWPSEHTNRPGIRVYSENWSFFHNNVGQRERNWYSDAFVFVKLRFDGDWRQASRWCWRAIERMQQPPGGEQPPNVNAVLASLAEAAGVKPPPPLPDGLTVRIEKPKVYWINDIAFKFDITNAGVAKKIKKGLAEEGYEVCDAESLQIVERLRYELAAIEELAKRKQEADLAALAAPDADTPFLREQIVVNSAEDYEMVDAAMKGLSKMGSDENFTELIFRRNEEVVRIGPDMTISTIQAAGLRTLISRAVLFVKVGEKGPTKTRVPGGIAEQVIAETSNQTLRKLVGVSDLPTLRPDGSIVQRSGYDEPTGVFHHLDRWNAEIPENPTREDAVAAANRILALVEEFAWIEDSKASWFAGLLTGCARDAFFGPSPLLAVEADNAESGKSLLVKLISIVVTGNEGQTQAPVDRSDAEMRKRITGILQAGEKVVLLDDQKTSLGGIMDTLLTSENWSDRLLGGNSIGRYPNRTLWTVTGNHIRFSGDTFRRVLLCRLDNQTRKEFKFGDLKKHFAEHRQTIYADALTVVSAFLRSGDLPQESPLKSFESWSRVIGGAVAWTGVCGDPLWSRKSEDIIAKHDYTMHRLGIILDGVQEMAVDAARAMTDLADEQAKHTGVPYEGPDQFGVTVKEMLFRFEGAKDNEFPHFEHMLEELGCFGDKRANLLGKILRSNKGKVCTVDGRRLITNGFGIGKRVKWLVEDFCREKKIAEND